MAEEESSSILQFAPFQSFVDESFWHKFSSLKLNVLKTDDSPLPICGFYSPCSNPHLSSHLSLFSESLILDSPSPKGNRNKCPVPGTFYNTNTIEAYRSLDRHKLLSREAQKIWDSIKSGKVEDDCRDLSRFLVIAFADLKKWKFHYWFAFPALSLNPPALIVRLTSASKWFNSQEAESVSTACNAWRNSLARDLPFFLICVSSDSRATVLGLNEWEKCGDQKVVFGFYDPCHLASNPGWPLRNYLAFIATRFNRERIQFLCYRETKGFADLELSLVGEAVVKVSPEWKNQPCCSNPVGWELNKGKLVPKSVNLAESMDSSRLAVAAADLNLKLMRWRAMPILDLEKLAATKCLLLGAGTLGCQVARMLMAWGVRKITLLDSGRVSLSNPLRQSLYTLEDCVNGGEYKAIAAVNSLKKIFPAVEAEGVVMAIPMPGHPVTNQEEESVVSDCTRLQALVDSHDVVFLLTDTRESRWLPSLMCASSSKHVTITAALGFESFLVMRHGPGPLGSDRKPRLGCYFCNDVVAPTDSTANRTLDQQCTVTRPGIAPIASSLAVEMLVNVLHHPLGVEAGHLEAEEGIGSLPHQIRGSLHQFSQMALVGYASECCSACSETVVSEYNKRGIELVLQAMNEATYLEDLTGMTALKISANSFEVEWEEDGDDECPEL